MNPPVSDDGSQPGRAAAAAAAPPTLTLDTSSATSTPPLQHEPGPNVEDDTSRGRQINQEEGLHREYHGVYGVPLGSLNINDLRVSRAISRTASNSSLRGISSNYSLANITPLPSPAGSVSGSPTTRKAPLLSQIFNAKSPQLRPERLSPGLSPTRLPALAHVPSDGSLKNHKRNRSRSDYVNPGIGKPWQRVVVSGSQTPTTALSPPAGLQREEFLAGKRGIMSDQDQGQLSESTISISTNDTEMTEQSLEDVPTVERYEAQSLRSGKTHSWRSLRELGTGTFSKVMLGAREPLQGPPIEDKLPRISLVAVKICEHGPAGGADQRKIEVSLKRELDILKSISHPSLINLKAVSAMEFRTLLVLNYCPGGDLFDVASSRDDVLTAGFVHRVFAELVGAVSYLHEKWIVHRDIKLENVLVNVPPIELQQIENYQTYPHSIVTLTDLGLGRTIPKPPESPLLTTRCGSEDYAAPELLMGQEYDGRAVDAWALGVLLYAMVESRLPFDNIPGVRNKSPKTHRIARCDWSWSKRADDELEWDSEKGKGFEGAKECVEHLLTKARSRWRVEQLREQEWVKSGIQVEGGLSQHTVL